MGSNAPVECTSFALCFASRLISLRHNSFSTFDCTGVPCPACLNVGHALLARFGMFLCLALLLNGRGNNAGCCSDRPGIALKDLTLQPGWWRADNQSEHILQCIR